MPAVNFRRIDLDLLEPAFREKVFELIANCLARGFSYWAIRGYDTYGAQQALYAKGRSMPGPIVTNAKPGQSAHNFGLAVDFVLDSDPNKPGLQPDWTKKAYKALCEEAELLGLHSGAGYGDMPHVAKAGFVKAVDMQPLHLAWEKSKGDTLTRLKQVWDIMPHERTS